MPSQFDSLKSVLSLKHFPLNRSRYCTRIFHGVGCIFVVGHRTATMLLHNDMYTKILHDIEDFVTRAPYSNNVARYKCIRWSCTTLKIFWDASTVQHPFCCTMRRIRESCCSKFSSDPLARCPQALPSTYTFFFFFRARCWGWRDRGARGVLRIPPFDHMLGGYAPANLLYLCITPAWPSFTPTWPKSYPYMNTYSSPKSRYKHIHTSPYTTTRKAQGPKNRQLRVFAIDFFGK